MIRLVENVVIIFFGIAGAFFVANFTENIWIILGIVMFGLIVIFLRLKD